MPTIFLSAGELSGDIHGAHLAKELKRLRSDITLVGMGSRQMKKAGVKVIEDVTKFSTIGFVEPIKYIPHFLAAKKRVTKALESTPPDLYIPIDFQGFHMVILKYLKTLGIPAYYYISPQEWHWGTKKGGENVRDLTSKIIAIFPQEADFYNKLGAKVIYKGHPLVDIAVPKLSKEEFYKTLSIPLSKPIVSIFPGSRKQEIKRVFPKLLRTAEIMQEKNKDIQWVISLASPQIAPLVRKKTLSSKLKNPIFLDKNRYDLINAAQLSLATSGTITLEHAILETPAVVAYCVSDFSYWAAQKILKERFEKVTYIAMPNVLAQSRILPEYRQHDIHPEIMAKEALEFLNNPGYHHNVVEKLKKLKNSLGKRGVIKEIAREIVATFPER